MEICDQTYSYPSRTFIATNYSISAPEVSLGVPSRQADDVGAAHLAVALQDALLWLTIVGTHLEKQCLSQFLYQQNKEGGGMRGLFTTTVINRT